MILNYDGAVKVQKLRIRVGHLHPSGTPIFSIEGAILL